MRFLTSLLLFYFLSFPTFCQNTVSTDRPSVGFNSYIVPKGSLTGELGYFFSQQKASGSTARASAMPNSMFRYGLFERLEVRAGIDYLGFTTKNGSGTSTIDGLSGLNLGFKALLLEKGDPAIRISFLNITTFQFTAAEAIKEDKPNLYNLLIFEKFFSEKSSLYLDLGGSWTGHNWLWNNNLGFNYTFSPAFNGFLEAYTFYDTNESQFSIGIDGGLGYVFADKFQLDAALGIGLNNNAADILLNLGFSFLID